MIKVAVCVVFYNPDIKTILNAKTYCSHFDKLYIMDNSTININYSCLNLPQTKTQIIKYDCNSGIAKALSDACKIAIKDGFDFLLTMDQDSYFEEDNFDDIFKRLSANDIDDYGQIALRWWNRYSGDEEYGIYTTSSGTFINLHNYKKVKGFDEGLVVDMADVDLGYQFSQIGIRALALNKYKFVHSLGYGFETVFLFGKKYTCRKYSTFRYYYIIRNDIILKKRYGEVFKPFSGKDKIIAAICKLKPRLSYIKAILFGFIDGRRNKLGKYKPHQRYDRKMKKRYG